MFRGRFITPSASSNIISSRTKNFFSTLLFGSSRIANSSSSSSPLTTCTQRCCATAVSQQSDQAEYDEILKSALSRQNQPGDESDDSKSSAKLLRIAMPNLFNELNIVREAAALDSNTNKKNQESNSTTSVDEKHNPALLAHKYLNIDSPEVFAWTCSECSHCFNAPVVERAMNLSGCPQCTAKAETLQLKNRPDLLLEVAQNSNDPFLDSGSIPLESKQKLRWQCRTCGCGWEARVCDRYHASGAPVSGGLTSDGAISNGGVRALTIKSMSGANCPRCQLRQSAVVASTLRSEWHPIKNGDLDPVTTLVVSERKKSVWWLCSLCTHEWFGKIGNRFLGQGCPECTNRKRKTNDGPSIVGHAQSMLTDLSNNDDDASASSSSSSKKINARNSASATSRRLREALLEQKEVADKQILREDYLRQLEEHGSLKKILGNSNNNNNNNNNNVHASATTTTTTTTTTPVLVTKKAKPNQQQREPNVVAAKTAEKKKELNAKDAKKVKKQQDQADGNDAVVAEKVEEVKSDKKKTKSVSEKKNFSKVPSNDLAKAAAARKRNSKTKK